MVLRDLLDGVQSLSSTLLPEELRAHRCLQPLPPRARSVPHLTVVTRKHVGESTQVATRRGDAPSTAAAPQGKAGGFTGSLAEFQDAEQLAAPWWTCVDRAWQCLELLQRSRVHGHEGAIRLEAAERDLEQANEQLERAAQVKMSRTRTSVCAFHLERL